MEISDLSAIGRLGAHDGDGFYHAMLKPEYRGIFDQISSCYLIFNSDRVFFVTISEKKASNKRLWIKFLEDGIAEERKKAAEVIIATYFEEDDDEDELDWLIGYSVYHEDELLGEVSDYFFNSAQYVITILGSSGKEILIPYVPEFIREVDENLKKLVLQNAQALIEI